MRVLHLSLVIIFILSFSTVVIGREFVYQKTKGGIISKFKINTEISKDPKIIAYSVIDENEINEYECHQDYDLITWKYSNSTNSTKIEGKNESNILVFSGKLKGEVINKRVEIDSDPWYQDIMVPLSYVSKTEKEEIAFWLVNADDLKAYKMIATREGIEQIIVNDASVQSINYHISVSGFPSFIWKLETWFRENDSVFVKFDGAISGPFASKTLIELIGE